ncbi:hypothetical protein F4779DRAFT_577759 [Xylariaceae sp. FL0662B]|nr:hypothetical protein F4779DRAFT_577759 [Xylariaceae sp. FL0662B]
MPRPLSSSVSVKTESPPVDGDKEKDESQAEPEAAQSSESESEIALVASDIVQPTHQSRSRDTAVAPRCEICKRQRQRCSFLNPSGKCDKCFKQNYECRIVDTVLWRPKAAVSRKKAPKAPRNVRVRKCDWCRSNNRTCLPDNRIWPEKCQCCIQRDLPCSMPRAPRTGLAPKGVQTQNLTKDLFAPMSSHDEESESSDTDSLSSIPAVLPVRKRKRTESSGALDGEVAALKDTIARMEAEFQEVVGGLQARHKQELDDLRTKYEQARDDLMNAQSRHERRVGDLIDIMKNNDRRSNEIIETLKNK